MRWRAVVGVLAVSGCASWWPAAPPPAYRWVEDMMQVCGGQRRVMDGWPGARVLVEGQPDRVLQTAREVLSDEGYTLAEDRADVRCLKTALQPFKDEANRNPIDSAVSGLPPITERAMAVLVSDRAGKTLLQVWMFPKSKDAYLAGVRQPTFTEFPTRLAAAIKTRVELPPQASPIPTPQPSPGPGTTTPGFAR